MREREKERERQSERGGDRSHISNIVLTFFITVRAIYQPMTCSIMSAFQRETKERKEKGRNTWKS